MKKSMKIFLLILIPVVILAAIGAFFKFGQSGGKLSGEISYDYKESIYDRDLSPSMPSESFEEDGSSFPSAGISAQTGSDDSPDIDRLIIRTGSFSIVVEDVYEAMKKVTDFASKNGGFVVYSNVSKYDISPYAEVTIRIPSENFGEGVENLKTLGDVTSETINGQDVTEEFVDLDSQLKNLQATEAQLLEIMEEARKIEDILAVQAQLTYIRSDIERIQGRMKYLQQSADLSTLTIYLSTDPSALPAIDDGNLWKPFAVVKDAFRALVDFGKGFVDVLIWGVIVVLPVIIAIGIIAWILYLIVRKIWHRKNKLAKK